MFNVVKRRDFMLAANVATKEEAEKIAGDYGREYVAIRVREIEPPHLLCDEVGDEIDQLKGI